MKAVEISAPGAPEVLKPTERPVPQPQKNEVLVKVAAAGVNGPDIMQRKGLYPAPPGASDLPGLEVSGEVVAVGDDVKRWKVGDKVAALTNGGGYARVLRRRRAAVPADPERRRHQGRRRTARDVLHRLEQRLHRRGAQGRRDVPRARRRRRHRHDGDPARQGVRRESDRDRQPRSALRDLPRSRRRSRRSTTSRRISSRSCARWAART